MKKSIIFFIECLLWAAITVIGVFFIGSIITQRARGQEVPAAAPAVAEASPEPSATPLNLPEIVSKFSPAAIGGTNPILTPEEQAGVEITKKWQSKGIDGLVSRPGDSGNVTFLFGSSYPSIVCAALNVTDISLEPGEVISGYDVGDSIRWKISSRLSGPDGNKTEHLIVKPTYIGLSTSLTILTDRRTYHLFLKSDEAEFMMCVNFQYPPEPVSSASPAAQVPAPKKVIAQTDPPPSGDDPPPPASATRADPQTARAPSPLKGRSVSAKDTPPHPSTTHTKDDIDDNYSVQGQAVWRPIDVYSKDGKTYIRIPDKAKNIEAPVLFEEQPSGWFHHTYAIVNYRVHDHWLLADHELPVNGTMILVSGVPGHQTRVKIERVRPAPLNPTPIKKPEPPKKPAPAPTCAIETGKSVMYPKRQGVNNGG